MKIIIQKNIKKILTTAFEYDIIIFVAGEQ